MNKKIVYMTPRTPSELKAEHDLLQSSYDPDDNLRQIKVCTRIIEIKPTWEIFYSRGNARQRIGNFNSAIEDYTKAIEINPDAKDALFNRGMCYAKLGIHDKAMENFNMTLSIDPNYTEAWHNVRFAREQIDKAESRYEPKTTKPRFYAEYVIGVAVIGLLIVLIVLS